MAKPNTNTNTTTVNAETAKLMAELEQMRAENARLKAAKAAKTVAAIHVKRSTNPEKPSVVSTYGLGRFPVSLHGGSWLNLATAVYLPLQFMIDNKIPGKLEGSFIGKDEVIAAANNAIANLQALVKQNS